MLRTFEGSDLNKAFILLLKVQGTQQERGRKNLSVRRQEIGRKARKNIFQAQQIHGNHEFTTV